MNSKGLIGVTLTSVKGITASICDGSVYNTINLVKNTNEIDFPLVTYCDILLDIFF